MKICATYRPVLRFNSSRSIINILLVSCCAGWAILFMHKVGMLSIYPRLSLLNSFIFFAMVLAWHFTTAYNVTWICVWCKTKNTWCFLSYQRWLFLIFKNNYCLLLYSHFFKPHRIETFNTYGIFIILHCTPRCLGETICSAYVCFCCVFISWDIVCDSERSIAYFTCFSGIFSNICINHT